MLTTLGLICFAVGAIIVLAGSLNVTDGDEKGVFSVIIGFIVIGISAGVLYTNYTNINSMPDYIKIVSYENKDVMYKCKPTPFTNEDQCTAIKERLTKYCTAISNAGWVDLNVD